MKIFARHPDAETLTQYAARTLDGDERLATGRHLEGCTRCRETVKVLRQLTDLRAESVEPHSQNDILTRILNARAAGARALLPTAEPVPIRSRRLPVAAGVGVAAIIAVVYLFSIRNASAGSRTGTLTFEPAAPQPGQIVRATYEPSATLAPFDSVILRARFRRPVDEDYNEGMMQSRVGVMHRSGGRFTLEFRLPDSVVFAVFAVESPGADIIDDKDQQLWDLVTVDQGGKPLFDALVQKQRDLMGRASRKACARRGRLPRSIRTIPRQEEWFRYSSAGCLASTSPIVYYPAIADDSRHSRLPLGKSLSSRLGSSREWRTSR